MPTDAIRTRRTAERRDPDRPGPRRGPRPGRRPDRRARRSRADAAGAARFVARSEGVIAGLPVVATARPSGSAWRRLAGRSSATATASSPGTVDRAGRRADAVAPGDGADRPELPPAAQRGRHPDRPVRRRGRRHEGRRSSTPGRPRRAGGPWRSTPSAAAAGRNHRIGPVRRRPDQGQPPRLARRTAATRSARPSRRPGRRPPPGTVVEVEVDTLDQLDRALECGPDIILVDNLGPEALAEAVRRRDARAPGVLLEASGGVTLATVRGPGPDGRRPDQRRRADPLGPGARHRARLRSTVRIAPLVNIPLLRPAPRRRGASSSRSAELGAGPRRASARDLDELEAFGFAIERHPYRGVAYRGPAERLCPDQIEYGLGTRRVGRRVAVWNRVASTNDLAARAAASPANEGLVVLAEEQTAGRGRRGRTWTAPPGSSVLMSVLLFPPGPLADTGLADGARGGGGRPRSSPSGPASTRGSSGPTTSGSTAGRSPASWSSAAQGRSSGSA